MKRADLTTPPIERKADGALYALTPAQRRKVQRVVDQCCNFAARQCLMMDGPCVQAISNAVCCRWFRWAVLGAPDNAVLKVDIFQASGSVKRCSVCGKKFVPKSNRATYCRVCAEKIRRERQRGYMRDKRGKC